MSVRKRKWRRKDGSYGEKWMVHIEHTLPNGKQRVLRRVSPVQTKRGAESFERELRRQLLEEHALTRKQEEPAPQRQASNQQTPKSAPTLAEFVEEFLAYQATINKPTELRAKRLMLTNHLIPAFGDCRLDQIDARAIDRYKAIKLTSPPGRQRGSKGLRPKTVNNQLAVLGRMFRVAKKWGLVESIPEIEMLKVGKQAFDFLNFEEADLFIATAKVHEPRWHPFVVVALRTGLRVGELIALRWREDVDFRRKRIRVQRGWTRVGGFDTPKTESSARDVPLTWDAIEALEFQRQVVSGPLVFPDEFGEVGSGHSTGHYIGKIAKLAGLRHIHPHVLRHSFASHAVMRGVPLKIVQEWLGHSTIQMTMRYSHLAEGIGDDMIKRLAPRPGDLSVVGASTAQHNDSTRIQPISNSGS